MPSLTGVKICAIIIRFPELRIFSGFFFQGCKYKILLYCGEIYPSGEGWFVAGIPVTRFIARRRTQRGAGKQQVVERSGERLSGWLAGRSIRLPVVLARPVETTRYARKSYIRRNSSGMRLFDTIVSYLDAGRILVGDRRQPRSNRSDC